MCLFTACAFHMTHNCSCCDRVTNDHIIVASWCLKALATRMLFQNLVPVNNKSITKLRIIGPLCGKFTGDKEPVMREAIPCHDVIMNPELYPPPLIACLQSRGFTILVVFLSCWGVFKWLSITAKKRKHYPMVNNRPKKVSETVMVIGHAWYRRQCTRLMFELKSLKGIHQYIMVNVGTPSNFYEYYTYCWYYANIPDNINRIHAF